MPVPAFGIRLGGETKTMQRLNGPAGFCFACIFVAFCAPIAVFAQQRVASPETTVQAPASADPVLTNRPPPKPKSLVIREGRVQLDVVVADAAGRPVTGLQPWDLKLLDNAQPRKILSFHAFNDSTSKPDPPVEVILVIDTANLPFQQVAFVRHQVEQFLHENSGHLKQPVSLIVLSDAGLRVQPRPSVDGNAIAKVVHDINGSIRTVDAAMGGEGLLERFQLSVRQMANIAENEARKPGRKLLIWVGPGWPMLTRTDPSYYSEKNERRYFDGIVELSTKLREARMVIYSAAPANVGAGGADSTYALLFKDFLKPVKSAHEAQAGDLALKVLVTQSGGQITGPDNDLAGQIDRCVADPNAFYRISFDPPPAEHAGEYHDLKVQVAQPGLTAHTSTGYYNQPHAQKQ
jgi:VWFA-related protein